MKAAVALALLVALSLTGCGRLQAESEPQSAPTPAATEATSEVSVLLEQATDTLDQVNRDLKAGDDSAAQE